LPHTDRLFPSGTPETGQKQVLGSPESAESLLTGTQKALTGDWAIAGPGY